MQRFLTSIILTSAMGLHLGQAMALGFGQTAGSTPLGRPLSFLVVLHTEAREAPVDEKCVKAEVKVGERPLLDDAIRVNLERAPDTGQYRIYVSSRQAIDEPVVGITLRVGCPALLSREFLVFADPPDSRSEPWAFPSKDGLSVASAVAPAAVRDKKAKTADVAAAPVASRRSEPAPGEASEVAKPRAAERPKAAAVASKAPGRSNPVLRLDSVRTNHVIEPSLRMSMALSQPDLQRAAVALSEPESSAQQNPIDLAQLKVLEEAVQQLQADNRSRQAALKALQARSEEAQRLAARNANSRLVLPLAWLCAALMAAVGVLLWLRYRDRQRATNWSRSSILFPHGAGELPSAAGGGESMLPVESMPAPLPVAGASRPVAASPGAAAVAGRREATLSQPPPPSRQWPSNGMPTVPPGRPMSAEELIDLEQQVEFFVVLGQDEAAIDLLMGHVRSTGGAAPLPYLKLLDIYGRRGEQEAYERIRERINRCFNAHVPAWEEGPGSGKDLEGYPETLTELQKAWASPSAAVALLDVLLFRRDAGGPVFDVPAYRELLFLYGLARGLLDGLQPAHSDVDLLLPMGDTGDHSSAAPPESPSVELDLDISSQQGALAEDMPSRATADSERSLEFELAAGDVQLPLPNRKPLQR